MLKNKKAYILPVGMFLVLILVVAVLLKLPISNNGKISFVDAFFEATSNVTATGSNVVDLSQQFTFFGQLVILLAMQIGAIGFMLFFSIMFSISKKKLKLSDTIFLGNEINTSNYVSIKDKARKITKYTLVIEAVGAWLFAIRFVQIYGLGEGLWYSIFHSVSAFCNVGSDLFGTASLTAFRNDVYVNFVFIGLMFSGSLGFFVLEDLMAWFWSGKKNKVHVESKLILKVSIILIVVSTVLLKVFDPHLSIFDSLFSVVTARNTGLYTVDPGSLREMNQFLLTLIMFIGGSPGSNAGGIRVMVFVVLILTAISNIRGRDEVVVSYRSLNDRTIKKAITILIIDLMIVFVGLLGLTMTENYSVLDTLFYVVSSFSNSGLSTIDVTSLSSTGKIIATVVMYLGRIAPITLVSLFVSPNDKNAGIKYPNMDVIL